MALRVLDTTVSLASQDRLHRLDQSLLRHRQLLLDQQATGAASSTNFAQPKPTDSTDISPVLRFFQEHARLNPMRLGKYMEDCLQYSFAQIPELGCREVSLGSVIDRDRTSGWFSMSFDVGRCIPNWRFIMRLRAVAAIFKSLQHL